MLILKQTINDLGQVEEERIDLSNTLFRSGVQAICVKGEYIILTLDNDREVEVTTIEEAAKAIAHFGESWLGIYASSNEAEKVLTKVIEIM
mgnify:CR=1 FL=1